MTKKKQGEPYSKLPKGYSRQVGTSISHQTMASVYGFMGHPEFLRLREYERAMTTDDCIGTGIEFIKLSILASLGEYVHADPTIQEFVRENLARMKGNYKMALGEMITSALWAGFGVSETVYKPDAGHIWIDRIPSYNPMTVWLQVNANGQLTEGEDPIFNGAFKTGIWQDRIGGSPVQLPLERCVLVSHNSRYNNYYGESAIKRVYKNWRLKDAALEMWSRALDRYGMPLLYGITPAAYTGRTITDPTAPGGSRQETIADTLEVSLANAGDGNAVVIQRPSPDDDIELGTLTTGNNFGDSFYLHIAYLNGAIYRGLLIPQLLLSEQQSGSLGSSGAAAIHFDVFKMMLASLYDEVVEPFVEQVIGNLIKLNFGSADPGKFERAVYDSATLEALSRVFESMVNVGIVDNTDLVDLNMIRAKCGLPTLDAVRGERLVTKNHALLLDMNHAKDRVVELKGKAPGKTGPDGKGGGMQTTVQQQITKAPIPEPPKPHVPGPALKGGSTRSSHKSPNRISGFQRKEK